MNETPIQSSEDFEPSERAASEFVRANPTRRAFLRLSGLSGLAGVLMATPLAASAVTKKPTKRKTTKSTTTTTATITTTATTKLAAKDTTATATATKAAAGNGPAFDEAKQLVVGFTFTASDGFRVRNPYVAVWLEDSAGNLVRTIDLSFEAGRGVRYLPDLKRWFRADQARVSAGGPDVYDTISGPTRIPGAYSAVWDGRDEKGALVKQGTYSVFVEAAREKGPYEVVSEQIVIGSSSFSKKLADNGELQHVTVQLKARD